ncbi:MAG: roadblock/LC7 domain-containing protein [Candidatus Hermodarchaeota archaeon]
MIICQNCGTTNNEAITTTCRTCGALLPVSSKSSRSKRIKTEKKNKEKQKSTEQLQTRSVGSKDVKEEKLELQEIPTEDPIIDKEVDLQEIPKSSFDDVDIKIPPNKEQELEVPKKDVLQEIPAQPYRSSIMEARKSFQPPSYNTNTISDAFSELKSSVLDEEEKKQIVPISPKPLETTDSNVAALKQKALEKDMTKVLSFLSKKISVKKLEIPESKSTEEIKDKEVIPPSSMNDILKQLIRLDLNIEASAIIKTDGTILASAISGRISDSLFATIGVNLSMMGSDIIEGLDAGKLRSISVRGSEGILDLAPIDKDNPSVKDMILVILSHPKTKSGIISFAVNIVKKQLKEYLGIQK